MTEFSVGQKVKCKSTTSMAVQLVKLKVGDILVVTHVKSVGASTLLGLEKDGKGFYTRNPPSFPSNDFEFISNDVTSQV